MIILVIKTDEPKAELSVYEDTKLLSHVGWEAHLKLAETINLESTKILNKLSIKLADIDGIVCFKGPGSFTGLRIGLSVANALAFAQSIPIVSKSGSGWLESGIGDLLKGKNDGVALPKYNRPAATTPSPKA